MFERLRKIAIVALPLLAALFFLVYLILEMTSGVMIDGTFFRREQQGDSFTYTGTYEEQEARVVIESGESASAATASFTIGDGETAVYKVVLEPDEDNWLSVVISRDGETVFSGYTTKNSDRLRTQTGRMLDTDLGIRVVLANDAMRLPFESLVELVRNPKLVHRGEWLYFWMVLYSIVMVWTIILIYSVMLFINKKLFWPKRRNKPPMLNKVMIIGRPSAAKKQLL